VGGARAAAPGVCRLLPALAPALPVQVPQFEHAHPFAIYRVIRGTPLVDEEDGVREFLEALFAEVETIAGFEPVLTHSDLGPEHLLCRDGRLVGVIDWGDARVGDPALDYSWLLNGPFRHWEVDADLRRRARFCHRLRVDAR